jgi:hypothetical protein
MDTYHHTQKAGPDGDLFIPGLASNHDPPNLHLLSSWDYICESLLLGVL